MIPHELLTEKISIVIPIFNEEGNINEIHKKIESTMAQYVYELIFVDDGSTDQSLEEIKKLSTSDHNVHYVSLTRNFGHQFAIKAGIDASSGDCIITMDGDLQHPPELIPNLIQKWKDGFNIVNTIRDDPKQISTKHMTSKLFYFFINKISDFKIQPGCADFRLLDKQVADTIKDINESTLFMRGLISWIGFKQCNIHYTPSPRHSGKSKFTLKKMIGLAITGVTSSSIHPLKITTGLGLSMSAAAMIYAIYALAIKFAFNTAISGWTSLLISALLIGGVQMVMLGILGEYIGKILIEVKRRPNYIVKETSIATDQDNQHRNRTG